VAPVTDTAPVTARGEVRVVDAAETVTASAVTARASLDAVQRSDPAVPCATKSKPLLASPMTKLPPVTARAPPTVAPPSTPSVPPTATSPPASTFPLTSRAPASPRSPVTPTAPVTCTAPATESSLSPCNQVMWLPDEAP